MSAKIRVDQSDVGSEIAKIESYINCPFTSFADGANKTLTAAQTINGFIAASGGATPTFTTPTAAQIIAALPNAGVGDTFELVIRNNNSGTLTLAGGTNVTLEGTTTIATASTRRYVGVVTSKTAVTLHGMSTSSV